MIGIRQKKSVFGERIRKAQAPFMQILLTSRPRRRAFGRPVAIAETG
jgi:hypothetical protein